MENHVLHNLVTATVKLETNEFKIKCERHCNQRN